MDSLQFLYAIFLSQVCNTWNKMQVTQANSKPKTKNKMMEMMNSFVLKLFYIKLR